MATVEDVVNRLVSQTNSGDLEWTVIGWDSDGKSIAWSARKHDCGFVLEASGRLQTNPPGPGGFVLIGNVNQTSELVASVSSQFGHSGRSVDDTIAIAFECLSRDEHPSLSEGGDA